MPSPSTAAESPLIASILPRLHPNLKPLFDESGRGLPILKSTCQQILNHMGPESSAEHLAQVISRDHGLTCKVLQVANSIAYSPQKTIVSVSHAVSWLGLDTVRSLVAAAHLVEQLQHWPVRQQDVQALIAKSLVSAIYANELGTAIKYAQPGQLFTGALLYVIGDLAIAYQDPDLFLALQASAKHAKHPADVVLQETRLLGVPRLTLAQALAQLWKLPEALIQLFRNPREPQMARWQNDLQSYQGIVVGSIQLIEVMTSPASQSTIEKAKRALLLGSGLSSENFTELMMRATDRGRQLVRSMGLSIQSPEDNQTPLEQSSTTVANGNPQVIAQQNTSHAATAPIRVNPLATLQAFQDSLQQANDLNGLLNTCVTSLHHAAGFDRVGLALLKPDDSDLLVGRLVLGVTPLPPYLHSLSGSLSREHQFFLTMLKRTDPLLVPSFASQMTETLKPEFREVWKPVSAILAPLRVGAKPIGLLYCDRLPQSQPLSPPDYQAFQLFFAQTTLALNRLAGIL